MGLKMRLKTALYNHLRIPQKREISPREKQFEAFEELLPPTIFVDTRDYADECNIFIIGSDQVWNPYWGLGARTDGFQFASSVAGKRKLAYAASFGIDWADMPKRKAVYFEEMLSGFSYMSVREKEAALIIETLTGIDSPVLLDPTFLLSDQEWKIIEKRPAFIETDNRLFCAKYILGDQHYNGVISQICQENNYMMIDINDPLLAIGPREFLWLINHSEMICTDSFHAVVFSLIFHKPFIVFDRIQDNVVSMRSRLQNLDRLFDISNSIYTEKSFDLNAVFARDWLPFEEKLQREKEKSLCWLSSVLSSVGVLS